MRVRGLVVLALVAGVGYWIYKTRPTVSSLVDDLTRPLMGSKAVVKSRASGSFPRPCRAQGERSSSRFRGDVRWMSRS
jgi:hypothetical protein